jgi:hypothetical protein
MKNKLSASTSCIDTAISLFATAGWPHGKRLKEAHEIGQGHEVAESEE